MAYAGACLCLMVSFSGFYCLMLSGDVRSVSEEFLKGNLSAVSGHV